MTRYSWMIHTAEEGADGALGEVYLSLHGLKASTRELKLPSGDYEGGTVESGIIEVRRDLGELQSASLRSEGAERTVWTPDWVQIINLSDGRQWTAKGAACDRGGACPLLQFERTCDPVETPKSTQETNPESQEDPATETARGNTEGGVSRNSAIRMEAGSGVRTYEIFGTHQGRIVPVSEILRIRAGTKQLTRGAQVLVTDQGTQGFGLGGEPGLWGDLYPGVDPALYGLDSDKPILASDGTRGWVVDAHYLAMIFGADWRRVVYGN